MSVNELVRSNFEIEAISTRGRFYRLWMMRWKKLNFLCIVRKYHDESFGFRRPRQFHLPDYTQSQLDNRIINAALLRYAESMRTHGHRAARIDPLDLLQREEVAALNPARYGLLDGSKRYPIDGIIWADQSQSSSSVTKEWSLSDIVNHLRDVYLGRIAYEFMHSPSKTERLWFSNILESSTIGPSNSKSRTEKLQIWHLLARSEVFDQYLQTKFPNLKRYGLEGGESMLPALDSLFSVSSTAGIEHIVLSMPHRGRLNLLTDLLKYPPAGLFHKIHGNSEIPDKLDASGDVISHLVSSPLLQYGEPSSQLKVTMLPNPSHLEAVNPVAMGKTRAKQYSLIKEVDADCRLGDKVLCVQLHGDASFTGQGIVMESFSLSNLPHYTSGGSIHLVVNNSIGYTTPASSARSSLYCSDIGKMINAPVLHVNGDYPEDVTRAMKVAFNYRHVFRKDIVIDLIVYRRWGHNELDEPAYTQPLMYEKIRSRKSVPVLYEERLIDEGVITHEEADNFRSSYKAYLDSELSKADSYVPQADMLKGKWKDMVWPASDTAIHAPNTGIKSDLLRRFGERSVKIPDGFEIHPRLTRHITNRLKALESGKGIDWSTAEALAFGSLLYEGYDIRISGQDVGRGTFSQRHAMFVHQKTETVTVPLNNDPSFEGKLELANSSLSELAVLGFEYGMSWEKPTLLPIWEAQFGDFFNGAQVIIDTFISSAQTKWLKQSGIVLLLPHGLDGAGPDHSSMRIERMLQLTNDRYELGSDKTGFNINMHVVYPTTPAQYFHLLRRQMKRNYRKPLIVAAPKGLLRLPAASSSLPEFEEGTRFATVLDDPIQHLQDLKRLVIVTGKFYYDLVKERTRRNLTEQVAILRLEELSPFPFDELQKALSRYDPSLHVLWLQEEPRNQGAWTHVAPRIDVVLKARDGAGKAIRYVGRKEDAVSAPGVGKLYRQQQTEILQAAFEEL